MDLHSALASTLGGSHTSSRKGAALPAHASGVRPHGLVPSPSASASTRTTSVGGALSDRISQQLGALSGDPNLQQMYYLTLMLLRKISPQAVEDFVKSMDAALSPPAAGTVSDVPAAGGNLSQAVTQGVLSTLSVHVEQMTTQVTATDGAGTPIFSATLSTLRIDIQASVTAWQQPRQMAPASPQDPLALDLDGNGTIDLKRTRRFDLAGRGSAAEIPFVSGGDAFVALDRNGNGRIDDGTELFGDQHGAANGFDELAKFDENRDGRIDAHDSVYTRLRLLGDFDADGVDEQKSLAEGGVTQVDLGYRTVSQALGPRATLAQAGQFWRGGQQGLAGALLLRHV